MGDFLVGDEGLYRVAGHQVGTADQERLRFHVQLGDDGAHGNLDLLRRGLAHLDHMLLAQVVLDIGREDVTRHPDGILLDDAAQGDDGDFRGAASDVHHHVAFRGFHVQADTEGGGHGFVDQVDVAAAGVLRRVAHSPDFHFRRAGRNAHHQLEVGGEQAAVTGVHLLDEAADHHFRRVEVGDNAVTERTHCLDAGIRFFVHQFSLLAQGDALPCLVVDGNDRRLVQGNLVILENDGIGSAQVDSQLLIQESKRHIVSVL